MVAPAMDSCPKCGAARPTGGPPVRACPRCGLSSERMASYAASREASVPDAVAAAWDHAVAAWDDPARHDALLGSVAQHDLYAWAAAKYRDRKRANPDDSIADRQVERLRRAAEVTLLASASVRADTTPKPYRALLAVVVVLIFAIVAGLVLAVVLKRSAPNTNATPAARPRPMTPGVMK